MITPNLLSISTDMAHIPVGIAVRFYPPDMGKQTKCTMAGMPASTSQDQSCWNPEISVTNPSCSWTTASPPAPPPGSAMRPW